MFKKAAQIVVTFSLLVGAYLGYSRGFALLASHVATDHGGDLIQFPEGQQASALRAGELAAECFGADDWTASKEVPLQWYDEFRGYYIYAQNYERLSGGKRVKLAKFAVIWVSKDGKSRKMATSDVATVDMNQPFGLTKPSGGPTHIIHARMTGNVRLRDDKGTRDPGDDLLVGPMAYVDYEEKTLQITSDSDIRLEDRDMLVTGFGLLIQLRRKAPSAPGQAPSGGSGFDAETMFLHKNPHIIAKDGSPGNILPGQSRPDAKGKTPFDLTADGEMRIDLPRPRPVVEVGPPDLNRAPDPTFAHFRRNVQVIRGTTTPDQLNCDTLDVTLMPDRKVAAKPAEAGPQGGAGAGAEPEASSGPLSDLKLSRAVARGHAVWIQSESQGMKARCLELTYDKHSEPGVPDKTYLNGGPAKQLWVEKVDYETKGEAAGTLQSVRTVKALDTTIFEYGDGTSLVIARGPGKMEERPARNASVARTVWWDRDMELNTWREKAAPLADSTPAPAPAGVANLGPLRRVITLKGPSKLVDHKGGNTMEARERIIAEFEAVPKVGPDGKAAGDGATRIKRLQGFGDVHLTADNKVLTARRQFDATFVEAEVAAVAVQAAPSGGPRAAPTLAANGPEPGPVEAKPDPAAAPPEPAVDGRANFVHATIVQREPAVKGAPLKSEVRDAKLRGDVMVHQDPRPGEAHGMEATGEALDLTGQGDGLMRFLVSSEDPHAANPSTRLAAAKKGAKVGLVADARPPTADRLARVDFDGKTIEAPYIGLDQQLNYAWSRGAGQFVQLAERGLFDDKGLAPARKSADGMADTKDDLVITWTEEMKFFGVSQNRQGDPAAKIEFRGASQLVRTPDGSRFYQRGVEAKMEDASIACESMDVYLDRVVRLDRKGPKPAPEAGAVGEPQAQIAQIESRGVDHVVEGKLLDAGVVITSRKRHPGTDIVYDKQRIQHVHVIYDKQSGEFEGRGPGTVYLYQSEKPKPGKLDLIPTTRPVSGPGRAASIRARPEVSPLAGNLPPLKLTKVKFTESMRGRFGVAKDQADGERRHAEFVGNVQAANAVVPGPNNGIDFDRKPADCLFLTSDVLHVYSEPPPPGSKEKAAARQLLNARGNAIATTVDKLISGDRITYDSATDLTYVYGDGDRSVKMIEQKYTGQMPTTTYGRSAYYNKTTREGSIVDPHNIQFHDMKSGVRPKSFFPDLGGTPKPDDPIKAKRAPLQRPGRNSTDRSGFTGH